jgi:hypothetical protein
MRDLTVDPKFKNLIPALSEEEYSQLEANCLADGILDPIKVWSNGSVIVDGHNRYRIAQQHGLEFNVHSLDFRDRESAENWIDENQLGRRNLAPDAISLLRGRIYNRSKKTHGDTSRLAPKGQSDPLGNTASALAPKLGVSEKTLKRDGAFAEAVEKLDMAQDVASGKVEAPRSQVIETARALPERPTQRQVKRARESVETPRPAASPRPRPLPNRGPRPAAEGDTEKLKARIIELEAQVKEREEEIKELASLLESTEEENKSMGRILDADDKLKAAMAEVHRFNEMNRVLVERNNGMMGQNHALAADCKRWMNKFLRLEKATKGTVPVEEEESPFDAPDFEPLSA